MASELVITTSIRYTKNGIIIPIAPGATITVTGHTYINNVQTIGFAAEEALVLGDVATVGWCFFKNIDATNFVTIGRLDGGTYRAVAKLKPGEIAMFRSALNALYAQADTAAVNLQAWLVAD